MVLKENRKEILNQYIQVHDNVSLQELFELYPSVSTMTIRRDLEQLEKMGLVIRQRGSVQAVINTGSYKEAIYAHRESKNLQAKRAIARKAIRLIKDNCSVYLDAGTTIMEFAKILPDGNFVIATSAPNIALELIRRPDISVMLTGGFLSQDNLTVSGMQAIEFINSINIDIAFIAASAYTSAGQFTSGNFDESELKKRVVQKAHKVIMLLDSSKIGSNMPFTFAQMKDIDVLISEEPLANELLEEAKKVGTVVL